MAINALSEHLDAENNYNSAKINDKMQDSAIKVDLISRADLLNETVNKISIWNKITDSKGRNLEEIIAELPTIPQTAIKHNGEMECPNCGLKFYEVPMIETVLEDIKEEMEKEQAECPFPLDIEHAIAIIEKHISGKE